VTFHMCAVERTLRLFLGNNIDFICVIIVRGKNCVGNGMVGKCSTKEWIFRRNPELMFQTKGKFEFNEGLRMNFIRKIGVLATN
jgi:hypothetical protein